MSSIVRKLGTSVRSRPSLPNDSIARVVKLVDTRDLKSLGLKQAMPVRFRPRAPKTLKRGFLAIGVRNDGDICCEAKRLAQPSQFDGRVVGSILQKNQRANLLAVRPISRTDSGDSRLNLHAAKRGDRKTTCCCRLDFAGCEREFRSLCGRNITGEHHEESLDVCGCRSLRGSSVSRSGPA